jgi:BRCT domain type II-containing protein
MSVSRKVRRNQHGQPDLAGCTFAFYGRFSFWPSYHPGSPEELVRKLGGTVTKEVDEQLDYLVLGDLRGTDRAKSRKKAESLQRKACKLAEKTGKEMPAVEILDEDSFRNLVKVDVKGKSFAFFGEMDYCPPGLDEGRPPALTEAAGGVVRDQVDEDLDYLVLGNRRGRGKTAAIRKAEAIRAAGGRLRIISEKGFLELVRSEPPKGSQLNFSAFISQLQGVVDSRKLTRDLKMLKAESYQLFVDVEGEQLTGVVRSQTGVGTVYAPWLTADGRYGCSTPELEPCMGLQGNPCKHLLVLLVGLARTNTMEPTVAYSWIKATQGKRPRQDRDLAAWVFLRYKGAEAGEIDWRPLQTVPEDYYTL